MSHLELVELAKKLEIPTCPVVLKFNLDYTVSELVELSKGKSVLNKDTLREGIVCRAFSEDEEGERISFKVISPDFLLKYNE